VDIVGGAKEKSQEISVAAGPLPSGGKNRGKI
jgi:hypothetical protein